MNPACPSDASRGQAPFGNPLFFTSDMFIHMQLDPCLSFQFGNHHIIHNLTPPEAWVVFLGFSISQLT